jgi:hypothetical protein
MVNRRAFLKLFAAAGPVAAVAPTYFFAPVGGWKSDVIALPSFDPRLSDYQRRLLEFCDLLIGITPVEQMIADAHKKDYAGRASLVRLATEQRFFMHAYGGYALHVRTVA